MPKVYISIVCKSGQIWRLEELPDTNITRGSTKDPIGQVWLKLLEW